MAKLRSCRSILVAGAIMLLHFGTAQALVVSGKADPWLAGLPAGATASSGDVAPAESPVLVPSLPLTAGKALVFGVTGSVSHVPSPSGDSPDGGGITSHSAGAQNGIAGLTAPFHSLIGVFLDANLPTASTAPAALNFASLGRTFASLSPLLQQPFFIGDGLTGTGTGAAQDFIVPTGATRLFLGTMDAYGWYDNSGSFDVSVTAVTSPPPPPPNMPEPATLALLTSAAAVLSLGRIVSAAARRRG
jgi:hypothetical protein